MPPSGGDGLKETRAWLTSASKDDLSDFFARKGFAVEHDSSNLLVIPSGFICCVFSSGAKMIRWGLSSDDSDTDRVKKSLDMLLQSSEELRETSADYTEFQRYLNE